MPDEDNRYREPTDGVFKKSMCSFPFKACVMLAVMSMAASGCALVKLKKEFSQGLASTIIVGRIYGEFTEKGPIIVAACDADNANAVEGYTVLHDSGEYELLVGQGNYNIIAFQDRNSNLVYEANEPGAQYGDPTSVRAPGEGVVYDIDIEIPRNGEKIIIPRDTEISSIKPEKLYSRQAGAIADLDDDRFSEEYGSKGYWEPYSFFKEMGGSIYFLEEYDPDKIPVLFIHGATGTPKGWKNFIDRIDRDRFQPWFFYYPSGARIDSMSYLLFWKLINLQTKYKFKELYITAHSMGGLVARSFIVNYSPRFPYVSLFISIATPWGGDTMAELGVKQSPVIIPSWLDMQPEGDFIKSLYNEKLPEHVTFYMFSGYKRGANPFRSNNDGTINMASLLDYRPQTEAKMNYAFNEDHGSILDSEKVIMQYNSILENFCEDGNASPAGPGGYLKVNFSYDFESADGIRPMPILVISPDDEKGVYTVTYVNNDASGNVYGPFAPGNYSVSMVAMAAKPQKNSIGVTVEDQKTKELDFIFKPDGELFGCVTALMKPVEKFVGKPDTTYRSVDENIHIDLVELNGDGIQRTIKPLEGNAGRNDYLIVRNDYCNDSCFGFFGLPAGDYKITITADGYKPVQKIYSITPGTPQYFRVTELDAE